MFKSKFLPVFTFLFIAVLASCNFSANKYGSIFLDFTSLKGSPSASRNLIDTYLEEEKDVYVELTIDGLLDEPVTLNLMDKPYYEQDEIPVGTKIQVTVEAYIITNDLDPENSKYILYKGSSNKKTIGGGPNTIKILMKELTKKIYVRYDERFQNESSFIENALEKETYEIEDDNGNLVTIKNDGKTPSTGFVYIQSAIDWIAEYGNSKNDYEIILTGYGEEACFNQSIFFGDPVTMGDNLSGKVKESITISSLNPDMTAISQDSKEIIIATNTNIIFTNIKLQANSSGTALLELGIEDNFNLQPNVTLAYGTSLEGLENNISAVMLWNGSLTMQGNASINGYYNSAIGIDYGSVSMKDSSSISYCKTTGYGGVISMDYNDSFSLSDNAEISNCSSDSYGGAIYIARGASFSMTGGSITSCSANYGGAVYIDATQSDTYCFISNGEIKENTANNSGGAVYLTGDYSMEKYAYLHLSDNAFIDPSNDIYLSDSASKIYLDSELTTDAETAALITLYNPGEGATIINCANSNTSILENCFSKFCVNPTMGVDTETNWYLDEEGVLNEVNYILEEADPVQIGDLVFADNTRVRSEKYPYLTYQMRTSLAGIVFYAGTEDDLLGEVNLIVGKKIYSGRLEDSEQQNPIQFEKTTQFNFPKETVVKYWQDSEGNTSTTEEDVLILSEQLNIDEIQFDAVRLGNDQLTNFSNQIDSTRQLTYGSTYYFPLLHSVMHYYDDLIENNNQTESEFYGYNSDDLTNNWYIPTVAEYYELYLANKNPVFNEIFSSFCNLEDNSFITATQCDDHYWRMADGPSHYYHFIINFSENIIKCDVNNNYHSTIPIHTYSL